MRNIKPFVTPLGNESARVEFTQRPDDFDFDGKEYMDTPEIYLSIQTDGDRGVCISLETPDEAADAIVSLRNLADQIEDRLTSLVEALEEYKQYQEQRKFR